MNSLETMFSGRVYKIPKNQRGYSWTKKEIQDLFSDLELMGNKAHYLGTVIYTKINSKDGAFSDEITHMPTFRYILEDGQQRLTTFLLIINELRRRFLELDQRETVESEKLKSLIIYSDGSEKLRIENENRILNECFSHYLLGYPSLPAEKISPMRCLENAKNQIAEIVDSIQTREELIKLRNKVCHQIQIISVDLADASIDRYLTFDAINSRGLPLSEFDKIKNFCILICEKRNIHLSPDENWFRAISNLEKFGVSSRNSENSFISELFSIYHGYSIPTNEAHNNFVNEYRILLEGENTQKEISFKGFIEHWINYSEAFGFINSKYKEKFYGQLCSKEAGVWLDRLDNIDLQGITRKIITTAYLLYANTLSKNDFENICRACEIYTFRMHGLLRYRTDKNSKAILELANQILKNNKSTTYIISQIGYLLNQSANLPDSVSKLLSGELNYKSGINLLYYFLYELEIGLSSRSVTPIPWARADEDKKESIEHILPQSHRDAGWWESHWPDGLKAEQYVHRLGNLVITKGNQELGRKPIKLKLDDPNGSYSFNYKNATNSEKEIKNYTDGSTWKESNILKRELDMIHFAIERWSIPFENDNGIINIPESYKEFVPNCKDFNVNFQDVLTLEHDCHNDNIFYEKEYE